MVDEETEMLARKLYIEKKIQLTLVGPTGIIVGTTATCFKPSSTKHTKYLHLRMKIVSSLLKTYYMLT